MHHEARQRDPLAAVFATPRVVDLPCSCIPLCLTAYFVCVLSLAKALLTFPEAAGFPAEQGTYVATCRTGPGMRPMPGLRVSHPARALHAPITPGSTISLRVVGRVVEHAESRDNYPQIT